MTDHDDLTPDDPLPAIKAALDQVLVEAPEIARLVRGYYDAFEEEGFGQSQALYLTVCQFKDMAGPPPT